MAPGIGRREICGELLRHHTREHPFGREIAVVDPVPRIAIAHGREGSVGPGRDDVLVKPTSPSNVRRAPGLAIDMPTACTYRLRMPKMIQLRHVPDDLHRKLKARAALEGLSLSDYLLQEVRRVAERPTLAELRHRLAQRAPVVTRVPPAKAVRAERGHR